MFLSTTGNDSGSNCRRFDPAVANPDPATVCATAARALSLAQPGDVVQLEPGSYGSLTLSRQSGVDSPKVIVRGDPAMVDQFGCAADNCSEGNVVVRSLTVCGHGLSVANLDSNARDQTDFYLGKGTCPSPTGNIVADNHDLELHNVHFTMGALRGTDVGMYHSRLGPQYDICGDPAARSDLLHIWPDTYGHEPVRVTIDHSVFWWNYMSVSGCGGAHADNIQALGFDTLTFTNNIVGGGASLLWADGSLNGTQETGTILIADNFFDAVDAGPTHNAGVQFGLGTTGTCSAIYRIENNVFAGGKNVTLDCLQNGGASVWHNNFLHASASNSTTCGSGSFDYNAWDPSSFGSCGTHAARCTPVWADSLADTPNIVHGWDDHLASTDTCLKGRGSSTVYQASDFDAQARPQGVPDIGADEIP